MLEELIEKLKLLNQDRKLVSGNYDYACGFLDCQHKVYEILSEFRAEKPTGAQETGAAHTVSMTMEDFTKVINAHIYFVRTDGERNAIISVDCPSIFQALREAGVLNVREGCVQYTKGE